MESNSNPARLFSILLVEDERATLEYMAVILAKKFPDSILHTATNGRTGLELFKEYTPDIVITDITMPEVSGVQMSKDIRAAKTDTKLIAITGKDSDEILFEFDQIIEKPVIINNLFSAIEKCIGLIAKN